ncbi:tRNA lysidine(34) synthetase TilS [Acinetobacter baumannii]
MIRRQGGEKIHLYGRVGQWPLKKQFKKHIFCLGFVIQFKY